jgi:hypothetical protein
VTVNIVLSNSAGAYIGKQSTAVLTITNSPYESWKTAHFGGNATNSAVAGDLADPDGDGMVNLLEYAVAGDPNGAGAEARLSADVMTNYLNLQFRRNTSATDLTYALQVSSDLVAWNPLVTYTAATGWLVNMPGAAVVESTATGTAPDQFVTATVTDSGSVGSLAARYFRLAVHR